MCATVTTVLRALFFRYPPLRQLAESNIAFCVWQSSITTLLHVIMQDNTKVQQHIKLTAKLSKGSVSVDRVCSHVREMLVWTSSQCTKEVVTLTTGSAVHVFDK